MDQDDFHLVGRPEFGEILGCLMDPALRGVLLLGEPGSGKTTLLTMVARELSRRGQLVCGVNLKDLRYPGELGSRVLASIADSPHHDTVDVVRTLRSSSGDVPLSETAAVLNRIKPMAGSPILVMDALDESVFPARVAASAIQQLSLELSDDWKFIVASRLGSTQALLRLRGFRALQLRGLPDAVGLLRAAAPGLPDEIISRITEFTDGNPVLLRAVLRDLRRATSVAPAGDGASSLTDALEWLMNQAITTSPAPEKLGELLERLALGGGRDRIAALAVKAQLADAEVSRLLDAPRARALVVLDDSAGTAALFHDALRDTIVTRRILTSSFRLVDLRFGDGEAEADKLLDKTYVQRPYAEIIIDQKRSVVLGERGSGKSAIFHRLAAGDAADAYPNVSIVPVAKPYDLLHKIVVDDAGWLDPYVISTAWQVVVAAMVAPALPASAPRRLRRSAVGVRAALGLSVPSPNLPMRVLRAAAGLFGGTTVKFTAAGLAQVEVKLPTRSAVGSGKAELDIAGFLEEVDALLAESGSRVVVMVDKVDEIGKWKRDQQRAAVRGLLQAVLDVYPRDHLQFVAFLRSDLYERCKVQEKTKLVSKMVALAWEEEDWLQVLVRRVLANDPFQLLASRLRDGDGNTDILGTLQVLFPSEIEGQPADRWLIDSLRNGNGSVSPRLAVNLLSFAVDSAARPAEKVSALPLFSAQEAGQAMTKLSRLAVDEVVDDFEVAPSFVNSCRAQKLKTFTKEQVQGLFDEEEGNVEEQVLLLERLGFLERIVQERGSVLESAFRIPPLYTRSWDHA